MLLKNMSYKEAIEKAESIKDLGIEAVWLEEDFPWSMVTNCTEGAGQRLGVTTNICFCATDPSTGIKFRWFFELEKTRSDYKGVYQFDIDKIKFVCSVLPAKAKAQFLKHLLNCGEKIQAKAVEFYKLADEQELMSRGLVEIFKAERK